MSPVFSSHAVEQMAACEITVSLVELVLNDFDGKVDQSLDKAVYYKFIKGRRDNLIAIVAVERPDRLEIITVMHNFEVRK